MASLLTPENTDRALLFAAIDAVASIRPHEAGTLLVDLTNSDDEDIVEAAHEAMAMAEGEAHAGFADEEDDLLE